MGGQFLASWIFWSVFFFFTATPHLRSACAARIGRRKLRMLDDE